MRKLLLAITILWLPSVLSSQVLTQHFTKEDIIKRSVSFKNEHLSKRVIKMPSIDTKSIRKKNKEEIGYNVPYKFGYGFDTSYSLKDGTWEQCDGGHLWSLRFKSSGAVSLNFIFENLYLPSGAYMNIANSDESIVHGPITSNEIPLDGYFLTDIIPDSMVTIYLYEPDAQTGKSTFKIKKVVHGYQNYYNINDEYGHPGASAECNIPVENGFPTYEEEAKGVALIILADGESCCSGSLVMSTDCSFKPYLLTAFHCVNTDFYPNSNIPTDTMASSAEKANVNHWAIKFNYRQLASQAITFNGANYRAGWFDSDFALVELLEDLKPFSNLTWLGWDRSGDTPMKGVCIHHPKGDYMKMAEDYEPSKSSTWLDALYPGTETEHWLQHWDIGIVQPGSSGSPLLNEGKRVVGQLHGVMYEKNHNNQTTLYNPCIIDYASFGKFAISWTGGGHSYDRLSDWLDPIGTGLTTTNSSHPINILGSHPTSSTYCYSVENLPSGYTVEWSLSDSYYNQHCLQQNYPAPNQCTITYSTGHYMINATLTATIKYNGNTIQTLTKTVYAYDDLHGQYTSDNLSGEIDGTHRFYVKPNVISTITSPMFQGASVGYDYSGTIPTTFNFSVGQRKLYFTMPANNNGKPVIINVEDLCGNYFKLYAMPYNSYYMNITYGDGSIDIEMKETVADGSKSDALKMMNTADDQTWQYEIWSSAMGTLKASQTVSSRSATISTAGWPKGVYVIKARIGKEEVTEKFVVK